MSIIQSKQSITTLENSDKKAISIRLAEVAILKGYKLTEEQISVWMREIERDLDSGDITIEGAKKALMLFPREKFYGNIDYYNFYELAKAKSIDKDINNSKEFIEFMRTKQGDPMPKEIKEMLKKL